MTSEQIHQHWRACLETLGLNPETGEALYQRLLRRYNELGRHYHNLAHVQALLGWLEQYRSELREPDTVALAIWYHDAIYSTLRKDNEARSAALAAKDLKRLGADEALIEAVGQMILQTAGHHQAPQSKHPDLGWFLDFDLSILGAPPEIYLQYAGQIRKEYRLIPEPLYRSGRGKILRQMLEVRFLYQTPAFRRSHERQARANLLDELRRLEAARTLGLD